MKPPLAQCRACPRLVDHLVDLRTAEPGWHNAPVGWHGDPDARLIVVGLAPGRAGANRTGAPFTGDASGDWLWEALLREGFTTIADARETPPPLRDAAITNAVKCVPPGNKPTASEIASCQIHLRAERGLFAHARVVVALGRVAHDAWLKTLGAARRSHPFEHGAVHRIEGAPLLIDCFHPSPLNTRTGRMTRASWRKVWARAARLAREQWQVYMLRCADGSLYTGITTDLARRYEQHASGRGAKYTRRSGADEIVWSEPAESKSAALIREHAVKKLTRPQKLALARR